MNKADVPRYSRISARFWTDEKATKWDLPTKLMALYLLTCSHRRLEGIFVLPVPYVCADLGLSEKRVKKCLSVLSRDGFLKFDEKTKVLLLRNALRYQSPENPNQAEACLRRLRDLPYTDLLIEFQQLAQQHCYRKGAPPYAQAFYQQLLQLFSQRFGERFHQHPNLQPLTSISEPETLNLKHSTSESLTSDAIRNPNGLDRPTAREQAILSRYPHLIETTDRDGMTNRRRSG